MEHHHHDHNHTHEIDYSNRKTFVIGIILNLAFVLIEVIVGFASNSIALLTDAGHNFSDVASLALSLVAFWMAKKQSNARYTYGYKKTTVLAALLNALILLVAIALLGYESILKLFHPTPTEGKTVAWVAAAGIVVNGLTALLFFRNNKKELNARSAYLHMLSDALVSAGVVVSGIIIVYTNWFWLDAVTGLLIMIVILIGTWRLLTDSLRMTIDAVPDDVELDDVKKVILSVDGVTKVEHVHVWPLSTTENALTAHICIEPGFDFDKKIAVIKKVKHELQHHNIQHSTIELEDGKNLTNVQHCK